MNKSLDTYLRISMKTWADFQHPPTQGLQELFWLVLVLRWLNIKIGGSKVFLENNL